MHFQIIIPPGSSPPSFRPHPPKPQPVAAAAAARPATIIAKRPRGRPQKKPRSKEEKLDSVARYLHTEYKWSLKDVIRHIAVNEPAEGDTSTSAITKTSQQQLQQGRVRALIDAIWGQPEVLRELEAHPAFPPLERRRGSDDIEEGEVSVSGSAEEDENEGEMSVNASAEDENEGKEASAEGENEREMSVGASADDADGREGISGVAQDVMSAEEGNPPTSGHSYSTQEEEECSEDTNNQNDSISSANILPSPHRTRGKKIDYISLALTLPPDPDDDDENDGDFALVVGS